MSLDPTPRLGDSDNNLLFKIAESVASLSGASSNPLSTTLTGFAPSLGTVVATDTILAAFGRLEGRVALNDVKATGSDRVLKAGDTMTGTLNITPAANSSAVAVTGYSLTGSNASSAMTYTGTWNTTGTPTAFQLNITDTASNVASLLFDLRVGGASMWNISKLGEARAALSVGIGANAQIRSSGGGLLELFNNAATGFGRLSFGGVTGAFPGIERNNAGLDFVAANGSSGSNIKIYNTKPSSTNFERIDIQFTTNVAQIWTEKGSGGGTARDFVLGADALEIVRLGVGSTLSFFAVAPVVRQASGANLTNNVTAGGTTDTIADFTSLTTYATDAAAIRNDIYQLARKLKQVNDALRLYGLLT